LDLKLKIKFYDYESLYEKKYSSDIIDNLKKGEFILGKEIFKLEDNLKKYLNVKDVIACGNATSALEIGLINLNLPKNSEIIVPSHTFIATINSIISAGCTPVVADINNSGLLDVKKVENYISKKTKAIICVNLNGMICEMRELVKICKKNKIYLIEESAQGFGAEYNNKKSGSFGIFSIFSFYPTKILGCYGDGGCLVTNSRKLGKRIRAYVNHGRINGLVKMNGTNSRLDNVQALILNKKLTKINRTIDHRKKLASNYYQELKDNKNVYFPFKSREKKNKYEDVFQNFEILVKKRNKLKSFLLKNNIETIIQWNGKPINKINLKKIKTNNSLIWTKRYFNECLCLPIGNHIKNTQIKRISLKINEFYKKN
jgi:dTDP-4-amino-4,6-dideoxygalactose transaminase